MNAYEEKLERRRERLLARADKARAEGEARFKSGMDQLKMIPFGQPILVGHYSEKSDRSYRRKACNSIDKGVELQKYAGELSARADSVGTGGVSSDDPDGIEKLTEQLNERTAKQEKMVLTNKLVRKKDVQGLLAMGYHATTVNRWVGSPVYGTKYAAYTYELSNNNANIQRIEARIKLLAKNGGREYAEQDFQGVVKMVENVEANRVQLIFPGKPEDAIRTELKARGFRWSPSEGAWQRQLNNAGIYWAKFIVARLTLDTPA